MALERLRDEQADLRTTSEDKIRALTRRLVGVASHQILEQDGLAGRLGDIIARQVALENRQSTLLMMADRLNGAGVTPRADDPVRAISRPDAEAMAPQTAPAAPSRAPAVPAIPTLRLGGPAPPEPTPASAPAGPRSSLEPGADTEMGASGRRRRDLEHLEALGVREQFGALESSMSRLEKGQLRVLAAYERIADSGTGVIQAAIAETGLRVAAPSVPERADPARISRKAPTNQFEAEVGRLEQRFTLVQQWRELADTVPFRVPLEGGGLTSNFGTRRDPFTGAATMHAGMDFRSAVGTPVRVSASGRVIRAEPTGGYGNLVEVDHGHDVITRYGHLSAFNVSANQAVKPGTVIGLVGSTGRSTGPHLHYETRVGGTAVDPARFVRAGLPLFGHVAEARPGSDVGDEPADD